MSDLGTLPDAPLVARDIVEGISVEAFGSNKIFTEAELNRDYPLRPRNKKHTLPFHELHTYLFDPLLANKKKRTGLNQRVSKLKPHEIRRNIIDRFISRWRTEVGNDIYPAFRLILCDKDRDRSVYHLKEKTIGRLWVKVMKINKDSDDGFALLNWRQPGASKSAGDFALRCYEVIKKRPMRTTPGNLTIDQVNTMLDNLSQATKEEDQLPIMVDLYNNMDADELMWIIRIIMRQMKVGATEKTFFDAWHPDADALFNVSSSLKRVCWELYNPGFRMDSDDKSMTLMSCFQPQLAQFQKRSMAEVVKAMHPTAEDPTFWIEEKLDGERMQMHYQDGKFMFWSRKGKEYTRLYGSGWDDGSLARHLRGAFDKGVKSVILDGEMITWDPRMDVIVAFGTLKTAALEGNRNPYGDGPRPLFRVFDILYLNGQSLINYALRDRRKALERSIKSVHRRMEVHQYVEAQEGREIETMLRQVIAEASEGLVIKNPRSIYRLNDRNDDWMKVKPDYMTEFGESLDLLVLGGYWGSGKRGGILSSYLCGVRLDGNHLLPGENPMKFWSFCKVGGGFTANEYSQIAHITDSQWVPWDPKNPPKEFMELAGGDQAFERPDVWICPDKSFVVEVKAASVAPTDKFRVGMTLRFPRFKRLREDKDWKNALSISEFLRLKDEVEKGEEEKAMNMENRRRPGKRIKRELKVLGVSETAHRLDQVSVDKSNTLFKDYYFYIMSESTSLKQKKSKVELEQLVKSHGGRIFQTENAVENTWVIGDRNTVKISALKKKGTHDIIRSSWILDSIHQDEAEQRRGKRGGYVLPLEPRYIFSAAGDIEQKSQIAIDTWGDSYARDVDAGELGQLLDGMSTNVEHVLMADFIRTLDHDNLHSFDDLPGWIFRELVIYINTQNSKESKTRHPTFVNSGLRVQDPSISSILVQFAGGKISEDINDLNITHIVVNTGDLSRLQFIKSLIQSRQRIPRVVTTEWIEESLICKAVLNEERFAPTSL
ncbi:ATP dependent DNA ligase domain-containing protein [Morchella snyderi]|nr:ATP dependent DNA ligase domain-containing protein [Morchella snyderi]